MNIIKFNTTPITEYMKKNNLSKTSFAKKCGISYSTLKKILNNEKNIYLTAPFKIATFLNTLPEEFFKND